MKLKYIYGLIAVVFVSFFTACSDMNDLHQIYLDQGEKIYAAKIDSVFIRPGDGREQLDLFYNAQRIVKCKIYWNVRTDSMEFELPSRGNSGISVRLENMEEGNYGYEIFTFDKFENSSLVVEASGKVYGENYKSSLINPSVSNAEFVDGNAVIEWGNISPESGVVGVDIKYENKWNQLLDTFVVVTSSTSGGNTVLPSILRGSGFEYRTIFLPNELAIDTFYTEFQPKSVKTDVTSMYLQNYEYPFTMATWDGNRWGTLANWITNDAMKSRGDGQYGGYDGGYGDYQGGKCSSFGFERWGDGENQIINGKIYQTFTLPAGKYQYIFSFGGGNPQASNNGSDPRFMTVVAGSTLPDVENISNALAAASLSGVSSSESRSVEFTISEPTEISLGVVAKLTSTEQNLRAHHIKLFKLE